MGQASFAAGCFWGVQAKFDALEGVTKTVVGYQGGWKPHPSYEEVCRGDTGHAETVYIEYDPSVITYERLLDFFWSIHDPTTPNCQGLDVGTQYRSVIFCYSESQQAQALKSKAEQGDQVVTEVVEATPFYRAEEYHQHYLRKKQR